MTKTPGENISHNYPPRNVFHSHSSNLPHLTSWIDQLISLTENSFPSKKNPTTDTLVQALQRYDAVFHELLRQTSVFSDPVTKMLSKTWGGVFKLLAYMIKCYHRYVKQTSHLQDQAEDLLTDRSRTEAANKVQKEEFDLERASLRARIRNLESELESMKTTHKVMKNENHKMRAIIDIYIKSNELNDHAWDILEEDEFSSEIKRKDSFDRVDMKSSSRKVIGKSEVIIPTDSDLLKVELGFRRRDGVDAGQKQLKTLNRLDIELNEILSNVLKEENRQRLLMKDLIKLIDKNKNIFIEPETLVFDPNESQSDDDSVSDITKPKTVKLMKAQSTKRLLNRPATMKKFASFLGNNSASEFVNDRVDIGIQVDDKDEFGAFEPNEDDDKEAQQQYVSSLGVPPLAILDIPTPGVDQPYQLRRCMSSFPRVLRIPPAAWTCCMIMTIYMDKIQVDEIRESRKQPKLNLPQFTYDHFLRTMGLASSADLQVALFMKSCESHMSREGRVALFASQMGIIEKELPPSMDIRDTDFILQVIKSLQNQGELTVEDHLHRPGGATGASKKRRGAVMRMTSKALRPDITRLSAINTVQEIFSRWLPDGGDDYVTKVKTFPSSDRGTRYVDVDRLLNVLMEPWLQVRQCWEEHARFLFHIHCSVYRVLQEAAFATDEGTPATDTILVEVNKGAASDCIRRPLRLFQRTEIKDGELEMNNGDSSTVGNPNKESVCEMMNKRKFAECVRIIHPTLSMTKIDAMFLEALDLQHENVLRALDMMWVSCIDETHGINRHGSHAHHVLSQSTTIHGSFDAETNSEVGAAIMEAAGLLRGVSTMAINSTKPEPRKYWINKKTSITQWSRPFWKKTFRSQDIEIDTFVQILIRHDVFPQSPIIDMMNLSPQDLWSNADMFHKQVKEKAKKEEMEAAFISSQIPTALLNLVPRLDTNSVCSDMSNSVTSPKAGTKSPKRKDAVVTPNSSIFGGLNDSPKKEEFEIPSRSDQIKTIKKPSSVKYEVKGKSKK